jgi:tetratricopeptide (TPR) repeat protein
MVGLVGFQAYLTIVGPGERAFAASELDVATRTEAHVPASQPEVFESPAESPAPAAQRAPPQRRSSGWLALDLGYRLLAAGDLPGAERAFEQALALGHEPQRAAVELGWIAKARGDVAAARARFEAALHGEDAGLAAIARAELELLDADAHRKRATAIALHPRVAAPDLAAAPDSGASAALASRGLAAPPSASRDAWTLDLYAEAVGWDRLAGPASTSELVPTIRLRALRRLPLDRDLSVYGFAQATRELGTIGVQGGRPLLHADDAAIVGAGLLLRLAGGRAGLFAQAGSAVATGPGHAGEVSLDARAGAFLAAQTARCWAAPVDGLRFRLDPCAEVYGEAVYASRFAHDVFALARGRAGATLLAAGPATLGVLAEARAAADRNGDWYDNLAEVGAGVRARLLVPFRLDVTATAVAGRYLGRAGRDPLPADLRYADLRLLVTTFHEF